MRKQDQRNYYVLFNCLLQIVVKGQLNSGRLEYSGMPLLWKPKLN